MAPYFESDGHNLNLPIVPGKLDAFTPLWILLRMRKAATGSLEEGQTVADIPTISMSASIVNRNTHGQKRSVANSWAAENYKPENKRFASSTKPVLLGSTCADVILYLLRVMASSSTASVSNISCNIQLIYYSMDLW